MIIKDKIMIIRWYDTSIISLNFINDDNRIFFYTYKGRKHSSIVL